MSPVILERHGRQLFRYQHKAPFIRWLLPPRRGYSLEHQRARSSASIALGTHGQRHVSTTSRRAHLDCRGWSPMWRSTGPTRVLFPFTSHLGVWATPAVFGTLMGLVG